MTLSGDPLLVYVTGSDELFSKRMIYYTQPFSTLILFPVGSRLFCAPAEWSLNAELTLAMLCNLTESIVRCTIDGLFSKCTDNFMLAMIKAARVCVITARLARDLVLSVHSRIQIICLKWAGHTGTRICASAACMQMHRISINTVFFPSE